MVLKFTEAFDRLRSYRAPNNEPVLFLLSPATMEDIYNCVLNSGARNCLELGTGYGSTTCIIAAALQERGGGRVTTVDIMEHEPVGVTALARHMGLAELIEPVIEPAGYNWFLGEVIGRQTRRAGTPCEPCYDFCFLDGAHEWGPDALAVFLAAKLLQPSAWLVMDDLDFKLRGCQPRWKEVFADRSQKELDAHQVAWVFERVVRQHPDFGMFAVSDAGRTGWARKNGEAPPAWLPVAQLLDPPAGMQQNAVKATAIARQCVATDGLTLRSRSGIVTLTSQQIDPYLILPPAIIGDGRIDSISLRLRLISPAETVVQLFWARTDLRPFNERDSLRVRLTATAEAEDITLRITSTADELPVHALRLDPAEGPCRMTWESVAVGRLPA